MSLRKDGALHIHGRSCLTLEEANERGRVAFAAGIPCMPIRDSGFSTEACRADESTSALMNAWHRGWTLANLEAPV